jgi:hypothetical protein
MSERSIFASSSLPRHLARGALGFGLFVSAFALTPTLGPVALTLAPLGLLALRGCPTCWTLGLIETISAGRLRRSCAEGGCALGQVSRRRGDHGLQSGGSPRLTVPIYHRRTENRC